MLLFCSPTQLNAIYTVHEELLQPNYIPDYYPAAWTTVSKQGGIKRINKKEKQAKCPFVSQEAKTIDVSVSDADGSNNNIIPRKTT